MAERQQVQSLGRPEGLRPAARPVDTTVAPTEPAGTNAALMLAETLSGINPTLQRSLEGVRDREMDRQTALAEQRLAGMTVDEAREAIASGQLHEYENPWFRAAFDRLYGGRVAQDAVNDLQQRAASGEFDLLNGDVDAEIARMNGELLNGASAHFQGGLLDYMDRARQSVLDTQSQARAEETRTQLLDNASHTIMNAGDLALQNGGTTQDAVDAIREAAVGLVNSPLGGGNSGLTYRDVDDLVVGLAAAYAEQGRVDLIRGLLYGDRAGADGSVVPSIASKAGYTDRAARILSRAESELASRTSSSTRVQVLQTREELRLHNTMTAVQAIRDGRRDRVRNPGTVLMVGNTVIEDSRGEDAMIEDGLQFIMDDVETRIRQGMPEGTPEAELDEYIYAAQAYALSTDGMANGMTYAPFEELLEDLAGYTILPDGPIPRNLERAVRFARAVPREVLLQHADEKTEVFLDSVQALQHQFGYTEDDAIRLAHTFVNNDIDPERLNTFGLDQRQADQLRDVANNETERAYIMRYAGLYTSINRGAPMRDVIRRARESFEARHITLNDYPVRVPQGVSKPIWRETITNFRDDYLSEFQIDDTRARELRFSPLGSTDMYYVTVGGVLASSLYTYTDGYGSETSVPAFFTGRDLVERRMGQMDDAEWEGLRERARTEVQDWENMTERQRHLRATMEDPNSWYNNPSGGIR